MRQLVICIKIATHIEHTKRNFENYMKSTNGAIYFTIVMNVPGNVDLFKENEVTQLAIHVTNNLKKCTIKQEEFAAITQLDGCRRLAYSHLEVVRSSEITISPGTFRDLTALKYLDLSLNSLRRIY
uniref:Uncharacterized protein n=1 Tax=Glossina pallidipes TaxID=7398 RepID=A0A1B0A5Q3_GLOPL